MAMCVFLLSGGGIILCVSLVVTTECISPVVAICVYLNMYIHVCVQPSSDYTVGFAMVVDIGTCSAPRWLLCVSAYSSGTIRLWITAGKQRTSLSVTNCEGASQASEARSSEDRSRPRH